MKQYLKLLMAREGKEVIGKHGSNLWLLTLVLWATFLCIAFSEGSMIYLRDKMEDPFTNWVNINKSPTVDTKSFITFCDSLHSSANMQHFCYNRVQMDHYNYYMMNGCNEGIYYLGARFFKHLDIPLMKAVLDKSNLVEGCNPDTTLLTDNTMGFIITLDAAQKMGYNESYLPTYIVHKKSQLDGVDSLGLKVFKSGESDYIDIPLPVLAVVRRLPDNFDMVSASFFYEQMKNDKTSPFDFTKHEATYMHSLLYYVSDEIGEEQFKNDIEAFVPDSLKKNFQVLINKNVKHLKSWKPGNMLTVYIGDEHLPRKVFNEMATKIEKKYDSNQVRRIFNFNTSEKLSESGDYISVEFASLDSIRAFETFAKENGIQLDMAQVASKENFNAVAIMAHILSAAMVVFAIVCIIMFLVNMLQSYFQKVKRNIGTFKAFGMNTNELILVYIIILISIVFMAVTFSLALTWAVQCALPCLGIEQKGHFNYLSLWNSTTYIATVVVLVSTIITVCIVMTSMLRQTPGDLIYDRN